MQVVNVVIIAAAAAVLLVGTAIIPHTTGAVDSGGSWDKFDQCKIDCNEAYGGLDRLPPALSGPRSQGYSNCILRCEREYWKDFDKETEMK